MPNKIVKFILMKCSLILLCFVAVCFSCDPGSTCEYTVYNNSQHLMRLNGNELKAGESFSHKGGGLGSHKYQKSRNYCTYILLNLTPADTSLKLIKSTSNPDNWESQSKTKNIKGGEFKTKFTIKNEDIE